MNIPFVSQALSVPCEWIDVNDHMNATHYGLVIYDAHAAFTTALGLGDDYVTAQQCGKVVLESHMVYEREIKRGDSIQVISRLLAVDHKRLHFFHELINLSGNFRAACAEQIDMHVDLTLRKSAPMSQPMQQHLQQIVTATLKHDLPSGIGSQLRPPHNRWLTDND